MYESLNLFFDLIRKAKNGKCEEVTLLDLQLMKYGRPTLDLAYFLGLSREGREHCYRKKAATKNQVSIYPLSLGSSNTVEIRKEPQMNTTKNCLSNWQRLALTFDKK